MTSRHTRSNAQGHLVTLSNQELARLERENRQQSRPTDTTMGDHGHQDDLAAAMALMQQQVQQMQQTIQAQQQAALAQQEQAAQTVPIGERNLPRNISTMRSAIVPPPCTQQDFAIKPTWIALVQRKVFHGLPAEIPIEHIESFENVCNFTRASGVPPDYIRCMLFPFSLDGKATRWLRSLPPGSLTSWEQVRSSFLSNFYTKARTAALRNKITSFRQLTDEPFCDAWERFNDYRRECPHHGFDDDYLLGVLYDGVDSKYQSALNSSSNGDFMTQTTNGAFELIKNMAASSANRIQEVAQEAEKKGNDLQEISYISGPGYVQNNQQAVPAASVPQDELKNLNIMMQQMLESQQIQVKALNQVTTDINTRMDNMFTELNTKYDTVWCHIRRIDVQLETLREKSMINPMTEHCNATELRREKAEGKGKEQPFSETALGTDHPAISELTDPNEPAETSPVRVYVPKVPYPIPPRHMMDPISEEQLAGFNKMVRRLPKELAFEDARQIRPLLMFFKNCRETQEEIKALYTKALSTPALKVLRKVDDPGKFVFPCSIAGVEFKDALCDSGSSVNLVSKAIVDKLGIADVKPSQVTLAFANSSTTVPFGTIRDLPVQVGDCTFHADFQIVEMRKDHEMPLIFGRGFMATVGAIVDMPNKRVSFSNINKKVFYKAVPTREHIRYASYISVVYGEGLQPVPKNALGKNSEIKEVLDGDPHTDTKKFSGKAGVNDKVQKKRVKGDPTMTLIPCLCNEKSIEYEVKCKGTSKPFSKVRVILTDELKEKGEAAVKGLLSRVLKLNMSDCGACFGTSPHAQPD